MSLKILHMGVTGLTVHPRPDGRHIRPSDVAQLHNMIGEWNATQGAAVEFNIEGYPAPDFLRLLEKFPPAQATLVPDPPEALTSNAGWNLTAHEEFLKTVVRQIRALGMRVSLFVDPFEFSSEQERALVTIGPDRIELYTERYADFFRSSEREAVTLRYKQVAEAARRHGIGVNAGHDLDQENLGYLVRAIPFLQEVSIGHALICEAIEQGLRNTIANYQRILGPSPHGHSHPSRA